MTSNPTQKIHLNEPKTSHLSPACQARWQFYHNEWRPYNKLNYDRHFLRQFGSI